MVAVSSVPARAPRESSRRPSLRPRSSSRKLDVDALEQILHPKRLGHFQQPYLVAGAFQQQLQGPTDQRIAAEDRHCHCGSSFG